MVDIQIKRSGFPVIIGGHEFWYDLSVEKVKEYTEIEQRVNERLQEIQKEIVDKAILNGDKVNVDNFDGALELSKETCKLNYDLTFGEGTFDTLYKDFPDVQALFNAWFEVQAYIEVKLEQIKKENEELSKTKADEYRKKLAEK
jgi:hypothetical protein|nr:MAG TPA: hypothetical protein [Caudoviricetes sp.]